MIETGDLVTLKEGAELPVLAHVKKKLRGRTGTVIAAWEPVNGHPSFWMQCTVRFGACGRKREVVIDLMQEWLQKCDATQK